MDYNSIILCGFLRDPHIWGKGCWTLKSDRPVSPSVISRLPRYYRLLGRLREQSVTRVSSRELSEMMKSTASQIRQDLNCFGGFGQQGYGYNVELLREQIASILGLGHAVPAILVGAGNLGRTIANQVDFSGSGFRLVAAFDRQPGIVGTRIGETQVMDISRLEEVCRAKQPKMAVICVPRQAAGNLAGRLIDLGIQGFWNFSSYDLSVEHENVAVVNMHLWDSLMTLSYYMSHREESPGAGE